MQLMHYQQHHNCSMADMLNMRNQPTMMREKRNMYNDRSHKIKDGWCNTFGLNLCFAIYIPLRLGDLHIYVFFKGVDYLKGEAFRRLQKTEEIALKNPQRLSNEEKWRGRGMGHLQCVAYLLLCVLGGKHYGHMLRSREMVDRASTVLDRLVQRFPFVRWGPTEREFVCLNSLIVHLESELECSIANYSNLDAIAAFQNAFNYASQ